MTTPNMYDKKETTDNYLNHTKGIFSWLFTLDHKRIGMMYLVCVLFAFFLAGMFALLIRFQLLTPEGTLLTQDQFNQAFTVHGAIMVFLVIIPGVPAALGNFVLPIMLGAKDVAFPKLNLFSWWLWVFGLVFFLISLGTGGLDTGWTFYTVVRTMLNVARRLHRMSELQDSLQTHQHGFQEQQNSPVDQRGLLLLVCASDIRIQQHETSF